MTKPLELQNTNVAFRPAPGEPDDEPEMPCAASAADTGDGDDWVSQMLGSKAFQCVPPTMMQSIFMGLSPLPVRAGQCVVRQDDAGDAYYIVRKGRCRVTRCSPTGTPIVLATLGPGDTFGEEALISEGRRNASVTMETDGLLMRLSRSDFDTLLRTPRLRLIDRSEAQEMVESGAKWVDVRMKRAPDPLPGESVHIPLPVLRLRVGNLDPEVSYICVCDTGELSSVAAFLMCERGFECYSLSGGSRGAGLTGLLRAVSDTGRHAGRTPRPTASGRVGHQALQERGALPALLRQVGAVGRVHLPVQ